MTKISFQIFKNIEKIPPSVWDGLIGSQDIFHSHAFLRSLENGGVEQADFQYILFFDGEKPIASAVLSAFTIHLDLFIGQNKIAQFLKKIKPNFFHVKILFCGTPVSIGQRNLIVPPQYRNEILPILTQIMDDYCQKERVRFQVFKEFFTEEAHALQPILAQLGFFKGYSIPYIKLPIRWTSMPDYLADLRAGYRRQVKKSLEKLEKSGAKVEIHPPQYLGAKTFFDWYMSVMSRAEVKLETLNEPFFEQVFVWMADSIRLLVLTKDGKPLAAVFLVAHGEELSFVWAGKPEKRNDDHDPYFNLLAKMVEYAIENGYKTLNFGQTAYYTKQRLGGTPHELYLFFKSTSWFWHRLLSWLSPVVFPKMPLPQLTVWR